MKNYWCTIQRFLRYFLLYRKSMWISGSVSTVNLRCFKIKHEYLRLFLAKMIKISWNDSFFKSIVSVSDDWLYTTNVQSLNIKKKIRSLIKFIRHRWSESVMCFFESNLLKFFCVFTVQGLCGDSAQCID